MRIIGVQEATESSDCVVPLCQNEADRDGRCRAHNHIQDDLESFWMSSRKEAPAVPKKRKPVDVNDPFFQKCVEQIREFHAIVGRWPIPIDAADFPHDLPPKSNAMPWDGGWQPLWDHVGAGQLPMGRGAQSYRQTAPVDPRPAKRVQVDVVDDLVETAVSPHQDDETPDDPEAGGDAPSASEAVQAPDGADPAPCAACGSNDVGWDPADGWWCATCGRTDADEIDRATAAACPDGEACVCGDRGLCEEFDAVEVADDVLDPGPQPGQYDSLVEVDPDSELPATVEELPGASDDDLGADNTRPFLRPAVDPVTAAAVQRAIEAVLGPYPPDSPDPMDVIRLGLARRFGRPVDGVAFKDGEMIALHESDPDSFAVASARLEVAALALKKAQEEFGAAFDVWENHPVQQLISANVA